MHVKASGLVDIFRRGAAITKDILLKSTLALALRLTVSEKVALAPKVALLSLETRAAKVAGIFSIPLNHKDDTSGSGFAVRELCSFAVSSIRVAQTGVSNLVQAPTLGA